VKNQQHAPNSALAETTVALVSTVALLVTLATFFNVPEEAETLNGFCVAAGALVLLVLPCLYASATLARRARYGHPSESEWPSPAETSSSGR
jgi:cation transporter-like permease